MPEGDRQTMSKLEAPFAVGPRNLGNRVVREIAQDPAFSYNLRYHRRRYGRKTFTWVDVAFYPDGCDKPTWLSLGDPWPTIRPALREIRAEATATLLRNQRQGGAR